MLFAQHLVMSATLDISNNQKYSIYLESAVKSITVHKSSIIPPYSLLPPAYSLFKVNSEILAANIYLPILY